MDSVSNENNAIEEIAKDLSELFASKKKHSTCEIDKRIVMFLFTMQRIWERYPDLRFTQLIDLINKLSGKSIWHMKNDDEIIDAINIILKG